MVLGRTGQTSQRSVGPHSKQPFGAQHSERAFVQPRLEVRPLDLSFSHLEAHVSAYRHPELLEMELDVLYTHIGSPPVVSGFRGLAQRIVLRELPHGVDVIVGIHERVLKARQLSSPPPVPPLTESFPVEAPVGDEETVCAGPQPMCTLAEDLNTPESASVSWGSTTITTTAPLPHFPPSVAIPTSMSSRRLATKPTDPCDAETKSCDKEGKVTSTKAKKRNGIGYGIW